MKYITLFETTEAYNAATLDLPNVSLVEETMSISYNPWVETRLVCKYNVTNTSSPTALITDYGHNIFKSMEIDDVMLDEFVTEYMFGTIGVHTVKYELYDETKLGNNTSSVFNNNNLILCIIPDGVTSIGNYTFVNCSGLTSVNIPNSVTSIGNSAFESCSGLTNINVDSGNTVYDSRNNCNAIIETATNTLIIGCKTTIIPDTVTSIGNSAFYNCYSLASIVIPDSVTSIGDGAFQMCSSLTSIDIPNTVTSIGSSAFGYCSSLTSINVNSNNTVYDSRNNCNAIIETATNTLIQGCKNTIIPNTVTSIGNSAFNNCSGLTSITIPDSVASIGNKAFYYCIRLTSVTIGNGVISIGDYVFNGCGDLTSVTIGNSVTTIGNSAFNSCSYLTSIDIPDSVTSIGQSAFSYCSSLTSIVSNAITAPTIANNTFRNIKTGGTLTVPAGSTGYDTWMSTGNYYLGKYNWTKVEQ